MAGQTVPPRSASALAGILDSPEIADLIRDLDETRWTGRPGYPLRAMVGVALAKSLYSIPTWTRTVALVREHDALREAIGGECPSVYAAYRFAAKLRAYSDLLDACIARVLDRLRAENPDFGRDLAIDASDLPAYANGQRYLSKNGPERKRYSDPDASWGHRSAVSTRKGGGFYGYKVHAAVCARTDLPRRLAGRDGTCARIVLRHPASRRGEGSRLRPRDGRARHGLRHRSDPRRLRGPGVSPDHPAQADSRRESREGEPAELRARGVDVRRVRRLARRVEVAVSDRGVQAPLAVDQSRPAASPRPA